MIQGTLLLFAKLNTDYAACVAVRSASVWRSSDGPKEVWELQIRRAVVQSLIPSASSDPRHLIDESDVDESAEKAIRDAFARFSGGKGPTSEYLVRKRRYAEQATSIYSLVVATVPGTSGRRMIVTAEISFDAPIQIPGLGRLLGTKRANGTFFVRKITSNSIAVVHSPFPSKNREGNQLGIKYGTIH